MAILNAALSRLAFLHPYQAGAYLLAALLLPFVAFGSVAPEPTAFRDLQIKAVLLYNFAQFVRWPPDAFAEPEAPIVIGVLGDDPFWHYLDDTVRGEKFGGRSLIVRRFRRVEEIDTCHILFISDSLENSLSRIFDRLDHRSILTVGESSEFCTQGGMVRLGTENKKVRLQINLQVATRAGLNISSKLLRPAQIVTSPGE